MKSFVLLVGKLTGIFLLRRFHLIDSNDFRSLAYLDKNIGGKCQKYFGPDC